MLDSNKVAEFFNKCAPYWDDNTIRDEEKIKLILDNANVKKGAKILDVACGTGVLIPDYLKREVASVKGIDISPAMIERAREKFGSEENVSFVCGDVMNTDVGKDYDAIVVYNAFPHFADPEDSYHAFPTCLRPAVRSPWRTVWAENISTITTSKAQAMFHWGLFRRRKWRDFSVKS